MTARRRGFTLVEVMVAMGILGAAAAVMVAPLYRYAQRMDVVSVAQARNGVLAEQVNRLTALPFDSLDSRAGCVKRNDPALAHTRCMTVTVVSATQKRIRLVITPDNSAVHPDTVVFDRTRAAATNPFAT